MIAEHHIHATDALTAAVIAAIVESHRPAGRRTEFGTGWTDHRNGFARTGAVFVGRVYQPAYLDGWDARHRLSCAAAAGMIGVAR
jgi:hypothetical protein